MANYIDNTSLSQILTYLKKYIDDIANTKQNSLNRTIWGASDTGGNISGNMFVGDSKKVNNYLEYANGAINLQGNIFITGGNAATTDYVTAAVNGIQIGGRNLIIRSSEEVGTWVSLSGDIVTSANHSTTDYIKVEPSNTYSLSKIPSVLVTEGIGGYWRYAWYDENKVYISRKAEAYLHNLQWVIPSNAHYVRLSYPIDSQPKFEKGNKATDWTPAPEDVDASISSAITTAASDAAKKYLKLTGGTVVGNLTVNSGVITGSLTGNASTATKLQTTRTIWGQNFDGSGNVSGKMLFDQNDFSLATSFTDNWLDGTNYHPWYGYNHHHNTGIYSTTISDFAGLTLKTSQGILCIMDNGNVGIGTTSPAYKLDVSGTFHATGLATLGNNLMFSNGNGVYGTRTNGNTGEIISFASDNTVSINKGFFASGDWTKYYGTKHVWFYGITAVTGMFLDSTGYLGIGTATPAYKLDVNGNGHFAGPVVVDGVLQLSNSGLKFADNAFGGGGDIAKMYLATKGGEATTMTFEVGNDGDDTINFITPSSTGLTHNSNIILDSLNYSNYAVSRTSAQRPGVTRLYRRDDDTNYSVQTNWTGNYWYLQGYNGDTYHAGVQVDRALSAASADTSTYPLGFTGSASSWTWGHLTAANGYSQIRDWVDSLGGDIAFANNGGQLSVQTDGAFWQREGQYMCLDSGNFSSYITSSYISNLVSDTFEPRTIGNNFSTGGTAPYNYLYLCRIGNSSSYSTVILLLRYASRYNQYTEFTIGISTGQYAYGSSSIDTKRIFGNATLYYVRTQNASGYDYYDIYASVGAWNTINWDISKKGDNGVLEYTVENTKLDTLPAGAVQFTDWTSFSATKVNNTLSWSGYSSGSFNGSAAASISIPTKLSQLTNDIHANIDGVSYGTLKIYPSAQISAATSDDGAITPKGVNKYVSSYALPLHGNADSATVASKLNIPITTTSIDNSDNSLYACYAPGSNSVTTKPSGVDGFGLIGLRVAAGWYGQILMADGSDMFYRNGNGISSSTTWKRLLDSSNYSSFALPLHGTADSATVASKLGKNGNSGVPMTFNWSGQSGQPSWLWGGNDGTNMYVYNPLNFRVNYANSASDSNKLGGFTESSFLRERGNWADGANARAGVSVTSWSSKVNYQTDYGNSLHIQGNNTWYNRLDFGTNGRIYFYQAINPSTLTGCMQYKGALAYLTDTVAASTKVIATIPANSSDDLVYANIAGNDYFRIHVGGASDGGWGEIATADGGNEPIYARQYTGAFANIARTLTLLDENGNTSIPGSLNIGGALVLANNTGLNIKDAAGNAQRTLFISASDTVYFGCNDSPKYTLFEGSELQFNVYNSGWQSAMILDSSKNMTVNGNTHINGTIYTNVGLRSSNICIETESNGNAGTKVAEINNFTRALYLQHSTTNDLICCQGGGFVGIGCFPTCKLQVNGEGLFTSNLTAKSFINSSDRNLKENILDLNSDYLNKVESVEFREFNFKDDKSKTKHYGVIAQDLQELGLDDLVQKDLEGNLGVDYISLLILEIKSLKDKLNELEKKLN